MELKKHRVHMLPTEDKGALSTRISTGVIKTFTKDLDNLYQPQHLCITSDEEIKEGDRIYDAVRKVGKTTKYSDYVWINKVDTIRKIIATTDPKLIAEGVKEIPQSFIEKYCEAGGIDKVLVEYELGHHDPDYRCNACDTGNQQLCLLSKLKTDSNNCIIIHPVEEKMYSQEEMVEKFMQCNKDLRLLKGEDIKKWIKENL